MAHTIKRIYWHWTATGYDWREPGHYHTVIQGDGRISRLTPYSQHLGTHTFGRNTNSVAMSLACMGGTVWSDFPPTAAQIESMCKETAALAQRLGWTAEDITVKKVLTHAEAAANRDYTLQQAKSVTFGRPISSAQQDHFTAKAKSLGLPHENYGPSSWPDGWPGGYVERWDLWQLKRNDKGGVGGDVLRNRVRELMGGAAAGPAVEDSPLENTPVFRVGGTQISQCLLVDGSTFVKARALEKQLGWSIETVTGHNIDFYIGGQLVQVPLKIVGESGYVKAKDLAGATGGNVEWDGDKRMATLTLP